MSGFKTLLYKAISPDVPPEDRAIVYQQVREAMLRLMTQDPATFDPGDQAYQRHLVEEAIRDIEAEIARYLAMKQMAEAQGVETSYRGGAIDAAG